jgi:hypothetical protein
MQKTILTEGQRYDAQFQSRDKVSGKVIGTMNLKIGQKIERMEGGDAVVVVESN